MIRRFLIHVFTLSCMLVAVGAAGGCVTASAQSTLCDSLPKSSTRWIHQLIENGFLIHDTTVCYPAFPRFALNVYNWGDKTFNSYDKEYVVGTGKNWKLQGKSYGWLETQTMLFPKNSLISMHSNLFSDAGGYISFMAVSVGYMWNIDKLFDRDTKRRTFNFDFTCSRFFINYSKVSSEGGMILTRFGDYNNGKDFRYDFDDVSITTASLDAYYFFNHYKYSHAAAYTFSKYQLRTAGTAIAGINYGEQNTNMDFSNLPKEMLEYLPLQIPSYRFHYWDVTALGGYARNWVLKPRRWLLNMTVMGLLGYKRTYEDATDGARNMLANGYRASFSCVYNHGAFFASGQLRSNGSLYYNSNFTHFSSFNSLTLLVGMRF
ncbi:MAG: DUF4421 domain-containing protein [Staphylococcus sp.]|nr:DUF4421 domain-containing protein [Staphylococcus sp.]